MFKFLTNLLGDKDTNKNLEVSSVYAHSDPNLAREMLKEATSLKKQGKYIEACEKLREAFIADGSDQLMVKERLRLPMYLQLAKKNDDGWRVLNELNTKYIDVYSQAEIANQIRVFLEKERKFTQALMFEVWAICKEIERDKFNILSCMEFADYYSENMRDVESQLPDILGNTNDEIFGYTFKGNPIHDPAYKIFYDRVYDSSSEESIKNRISHLAKKIGKEAAMYETAPTISKYLTSTPKYDLKEIRELLNKFT